MVFDIVSGARKQRAEGQRKEKIGERASRVSITTRDDALSAWAGDCSRRSDGMDAQLQVWSMEEAVSCKGKVSFFYYFSCFQFSFIFPNALSSWAHICGLQSDRQWSALRGLMMDDERLVRRSAPDRKDRGCFRLVLFDDDTLQIDSERAENMHCGALALLFCFLSTN